ncbi:sulfite exporter TauE/SafE family protein [Zavarzinia compransoris]|uniref:sulfite exporter TauE/SafE family protein n=1 Tax=Zavarzinia marina TaxID=2911065 RepID=UPI001F1A0D5F|nr:sulfite exporter TauE/SafE family protein [Zavarzinia marina]MCF4167216.1 sulfite exporter TauE/SafE family protein [Zavarzinia marina]
MQIYLPIAELSVDVFMLLGIGGAVGFLSGLFGVGGGFLITPLLIFIGVPAPVAVGTGAQQVVASSVSGVIAHWRRGTVDIPMGLVLTAGGLVGSGLGSWAFAALRKAGTVDVVVAISYVVFLGTIGGLMFVESASALWKQHRGGPRRRKLHQHNWVHGLPFKMRFRKSRLYISALMPLTVGFAIGVLSAIMGVGGGFILVPAMIYLLGMPTQVVIGTSLFQVIFVTASVTFLQAWANQSVDVILAMLLLVGSVIGAQFGTRVSMRLKGEQLRVLLSLLVLAVGLRLAVDLLIEPAELYSLTLIGGRP